MRGRPMLIRVVDLETTGFDSNADMPVEVACVDVTFDGKDASITDMRSSFVNPMRAIPPEVSAIHHIRARDVKDAPFWPDAFRKVIGTVMDGDILCAHNADFDSGWIDRMAEAEVRWLCTLRNARKTYPDLPNHKNFTVLYSVCPDIDIGLLGGSSHRALADAYATATVLCLMLQHVSVDDMLAISDTSKPQILHRVEFGKHKGKLWPEVDKSYLRWLLDTTKDKDVRHTAKHYLSGGRA